VSPTSSSPVVYLTRGFKTVSKYQLWRRWRSGHDLTVILQQSVNRFFPGKLFNDSPPTFYPHLLKKYIIVDHTLYSLGELRRASWLN
jgi:hypothetical protein